MEMLKLDYSKISNVYCEGIDTKDYPDFCDAYIVSADYEGRKMTEDELDTINDDSNYVYECVLEQLS